MNDERHEKHWLNVQGILSTNLTKWFYRLVKICEDSWGTFLMMILRTFLLDRLNERLGVFHRNIRQDPMAQVENVP